MPSRQTSPTQHRVLPHFLPSFLHLQAGALCLALRHRWLRAQQLSPHASSELGQHTWSSWQVESGLQHVPLQQTPAQQSLPHTWSAAQHVPAGVQTFGGGQQLGEAVSTPHTWRTGQQVPSALDPPGGMQTSFKLGRQHCDPHGRLHANWHWPPLQVPV